MLSYSHFISFCSDQGHGPNLLTLSREVTGKTKGGGGETENDLRKQEGVCRAHTHRLTGVSFSSFEAVLGNGLTSIVCRGVPEDVPGAHEHCPQSVVETELCSPDQA